jgi:membrane protein
MQLPRRLRSFWETLRESATAFKEVQPLTEAGSLAYTTVFAIPGVLLMVLAVASLFYDPGNVREALYTQAGSLIGPDTANDLETMVRKASEQKSGLLGRIMGIVALVFGATAAFAALQDSLNKIWRVEAEPGRAIARYLLSRAISLGLIAAFGFLLLVSLVLDAVLVSLGERLGGALPETSVLAGAAGLLLSFAVVSAVFAAVFKFLPDVKVPWRAVWTGALFTAVLFSLGKYLIGLYIAQTGAGSVFGAGGAVIVIMIWIYYSALLLLFGAQYTQVSAKRHHLQVRPARQAHFTTERK